MLNSGDVFAGFTIERLLGQGGMGSVYLARHPRLGKLTALKLLNRELYADREIRARFEREADLVARLDHPNIVEVYDRGTEDEMLWISMQYVDGVDAAGINVATLPPERAVQVIEGVASALDYAHGMGVLHRDVKPANIILARAVAGHGERVFLTDFGIARLREDSTHLTQAGMFTATLAYASPEQMTGAHLDPTTDQYSLACALYWLLIGAGPYDSPHPAELIRGHLQLLPPPVSLRRPGLSPAMDAVLTKAMAKRPADRFPTCTDFAKAARRALSGPPAQHPVHQHPTYSNLPAPQPNYAAPQPYPAPAYPVPPPAYPATVIPPGSYPPPPPAPNYPAPQPQSGPSGSQQPAAPAYPALPQQPAAPSGYPAPPQPRPADGSGYPNPQPGAAMPPSPQDTDRVGSGPTARPYAPTQESAPAGYSAPPQQPNPMGHVGSGPVVREFPQAGQSVAGAGYPAPQGQPTAPDDVSQRPTDIVPQPVVSAPQPDESSTEDTDGRESGHEVSGPDLPESAGSSVAAEDSSNSAGLVSPGEPDSGEADIAKPGAGGTSGALGVEEIIAEPVTALARPVAAPPATPGGSAAESTAVVAEEESGSARAEPGADESLRSDATAAVESSASGAEAESGAAPAVADSGGAEDESGGVSRHPDSGAFVPGGTELAGGPDGLGGLTFESAAPDFAVSEPVSGGMAEMPGSGAPMTGMPGYASYGGVAPGGPGYGGPPYPGNPVQPGLIPASQRAESSQLTAMVVLGLAVVALVLLVVVAVLVVSG
ncbi:protein kinase domain-containing protein [Nocardia sp. CA-151230]|uniref:serine/threonine-protein kinase n=1 Tax=Nocardia sp. CA-151230 TaxID=3239982 RepID=UPI003D8A060C